MKAVRHANSASKRRSARSSRADLGPPRDFSGYGRNPPDPKWPGAARVAVNINLNVEAGGEHCLLEGDDRSEDALNDIGLPSYRGARNPAVESIFEYGPRSGCWRLLRIFRRFDVKISVLGVVRALEQCPELTQAFLAEGHEIVSHGYRWLDYLEIDEQVEREHIRLAVAGIRNLTGQAPVGWFSGRPSANTRRLVVEHGGFLYDRDYLGDELPFWVAVGRRTHLVIPSSYETNDNRFDRNSGFRTADGFARYMMDAFDLLYEEGAERPKMMAVNLHDRLIGRPAKAVGLIEFLEHVRKHDRVWFCTGRDIAAHWRVAHPSPEVG
ncbi:MAG: polysaccharide deacetylase family protein [Hyphomicrobiales bacterium]|nr:polysaccharide deacetylase family protein [Hyphomicrobiales bacterium]